MGDCRQLCHIIYLPASYTIFIYILLSGLGPQFIHKMYNAKIYEYFILIFYEFIKIPIYLI